MPGSEKQALPFVSRDQLNFGPGTVVSLKIFWQSNSTGAAYLVGFTRNGQFKFPLIGAGDGTSLQTTKEIPDIPIWVSVIDSDFNYSENSAYVQVGLQINGEFITNLFTGYLDYTRALSWPAPISEKRHPGGGRIATVTTANPAAGAQISYTTVANQFMRVRNIVVTLVTSATVANRLVGFRFSDPIGGARKIISPVAQTATQTKTYYLAEYNSGMGTSSANEIFVPLPNELFLNSGTVITTVTDNMDGTDDFGAATIGGEFYFSDT